jgi:hypothetical protein
VERLVRFWFQSILLIAALFSFVLAADSQQTAIQEPVVLVQSVLTEANAVPFHLKATITEGRERDTVGHVEMIWLAPNKWRRTIEAEDFSQTLVVNGGNVYEKDSEDYIPLSLDVLVSAMVDPRPVLVAHRPGDILLTKANGSSDESGKICYGGKFNMCGVGKFGLAEEVGTPGYRITFTDYRRFKDKRVARLLNFTVGVGEFLSLQVDELKEIKTEQESLFLIESPTPKQDQIRSVQLSESALRAFNSSTPEIIWPQVLDGATTGNASFYISLDRNGNVREVLPVHTDNERSNDSARRQLMRWKFKPIIQDGVAVQAGSIFNFKLNTRAWGPPSPLGDSEARNLASQIVEPTFPSGTPAGTTYSIWVAVDSDGKIIEEIPAEGPTQLLKPCMDALAKWQFKPVMENGEPRPYRAKLVFGVH